MPTILIAEDDPLQRRTARRILEKDGDYAIVEAADGAEALLRLKDTSHPVTLALIDLGMPGVDGMSVLRHAAKLALPTLFIVLTGSERIEDVVEAMRFGAVDFITKPAERQRLNASVRNALALRSLRVEVSRLREASPVPHDFDAVLEVSPALRDLVALGRRAAGSEIAVLITGESGVGKEVFARALHHESRRAEGPFVAVNCGALPPNLVESALFGHEKGAFTGAVTSAPGKCREADGGTLFLDEAGELTPDIQVKLLRLLQEGEVEPVGAGRAVRVNLRIISATNRALEALVAQGRFREDLYYRLNGLPLHVPPLRERRDDIPALARHLLRRIALTEGRDAPGLSPEATAWLRQYDWPGNVRELHHALARAMLVCEEGRIETADLQRWTQPLTAVSGKDATVLSLIGADGRVKPLEQIEAEAIAIALSLHGGHVGQASAALGIGQSTLYKRMRNS